MQLLHSSIVTALESMHAGDSLVISVQPAADGASFSLSSPGKDAPSLSNEPSLSTLVIPTEVRTGDNGTCELLVKAVPAAE